MILKIKSKELRFFNESKRTYLSEDIELVKDDTTIKPLGEIEIDTNLNIVYINNGFSIKSPEYKVSGNMMRIYIDEENGYVYISFSYTERNKVTKDKELSVIPDPMFDPLNETNIDRATAISFQVKEGDYIQVISPTGRQCSDFVAFDTKKLDKKIEKGLDWQTTRTFMASTFPGPGLYSKFYDTDHEPLVLSLIHISEPTRPY